MSLNSKGLSKRMASQLSRRNFVAAGTLVIWSFRSGFSAETSPMHNNLVGENSNGSQQGDQAEVQSSQNADVWQGLSLDGWMGLDGQAVSGGWQAKDGVISLKKSLLRSGHIVTRQEFGDFELGFEWRLAKGGNSGIKYRVRTYGDRTLGCEYQIYDPNGGVVEKKNSTASIYDLYEPNDQVHVRAIGEWNTAKIVVRAGRIEHWLNESKVVEATIGDKEWERRVAESKFNDVKDFSKNPCGRIMLTDHGSDVAYRNFQFSSFGTEC
jgi:hypothetical protein